MIGALLELSVRIRSVVDVVYLLAAYPVVVGDEPGTIGLDRVRAIVADDWGWWRTLTGTVEHIRDLAEARRGDLLPTGGSHDVLGGLDLIQEAADTVPKTLRWKMRARIGAETLVPGAG